MKTTLILPSVGKVKGQKYIKSWQMYPLNLAVLAGLTPKDVEVRFLDDRLDEIPYDEPTDLVAMSTETYNAQRTYNIASEFRSRGVPVVLGGIQASLDTLEVSEHADAVVVGDAEPVWDQLIRDAKNGKLQKIYRAQPRKGTLQHVQPRRDLFEGKKYLPVGLVETGRGCPFTCDFCAIAGSYEGSYRTKALDDIVSDIESTNQRNLYFVDDNFISRFSRTKDLCDAIAPLGKKWMSQGSINMADNPELLKGLEKSGCVNILIGFESLNPETLKSMGKTWNVAKRDYGQAIQRLRDHGVSIYGTFVFGYDSDTKDDFKRTVDFAIEHKLALAAFNHLIPFPGTTLYRRLKEEGRLHHDKWWLESGYRFGEVAFDPKNMSPEELAENCFDARREFYSYSSIFHRMQDMKANLKDFSNAAYFFWVNLFSGKEVARRQGWPIGGVIKPSELYDKRSNGNGSYASSQKRDDVSKLSLPIIK